MLDDIFELILLIAESIIDVLRIGWKEKKEKKKRQKKASKK